MRLTGLATGLDTDTMIKDMMKPYKAKVDKQKQQRDTIQWKQQLYRDVIKDMRGFYDKFFDPLSKDNITLGKNLTTTSVKVDKESVAGITTSPGAKTGTYSLNVNKLAESPKVTSSKLDNGLETDLGLTSDTKLTFKVEGKNIDVELKAGDTAKDLMNKVNSSLKDYGIKAEYSEFTKQLTIASNKTGESSKLEVIGLDSLSKIGISNPSENSSYKTNTLDLGITDLKADTKLDSLEGKVLKIGDKEITIKKEDTVQSLMNSIKDNGGQSVSLKDGKIIYTTDAAVDNIYDGNEITNTIETFGVLKGSNSEYEVILPGSKTPISMTNEKNNFMVDGINFNFNGIGETSFTIATDTQETVDKLKGFVDEYNKLVEDIYKKVTERKNYKYEPLTEDQKSEMTEKEIELWESKAQAGLLKNDRELNSFLTSLRNALFEPVEGAGISLKDIGIEMSSDTTKPGQIVLNEEKLKSSLENDPEVVMKVLNGTSDSKDENEKYKQSGVFTRMKDIFYNTSKTTKSSLIQKAGYEGTSTAVKNELSEKIEKQQKVIDKMEKDLITRENAFYLKFANLEKVMNNLNSQQNYLVQQLGM